MYEDITIYHHTEDFLIPLLIIDTYRGIFLFEYKDWSYNDLKNSTISKASHQDSSDQSLSYENKQEFIRQKFNELSHNDGVPLHNFLLMENLNTEQYDYLDNSFKELLPFEKIIFNDTAESEIIKKLQSSTDVQKNPYNLVDIVGNLFIQYTILTDEEEKYVATEEQIEFIDSDNIGTSTIYGVEKSGKTSAIILKALKFALDNPRKKTIIIKPTHLDCDMLKHALNITIEHAMIEIDIDSITIITPDEFILKKIKKADLLICDDTERIDMGFLSKIRVLQKSRELVLVTSNIGDNNFSLTKPFNKSTDNFVFMKDEYNKEFMIILTKLLQNNFPEEILVFTTSQNRELLINKVESLIPNKVTALDSSNNLINQNLDKLLIQTYDEISTLSSKFILLLDIENIPIEDLLYASKRSTNFTYIIYENESEKVKSLKTKLA